MGGMSCGKVVNSSNKYRNINFCQTVTVTVNAKKREREKTKEEKREKGVVE